MLKINIGCGSDIKEGYVNIDARDLPGVDLVHDLNNNLPFDDNSVDEVFASDVLEHFPMAKSNTLLKDWVRVVKVGGQIHVRVPHMRLLALKLANKKLKDEVLIELIYGGQDYPGNFHMAGFTEEMLIQKMKVAGCTRIVKTFPSDHNINVIGEK